MNCICGRKMHLNNGKYTHDHYMVPTENSAWIVEGFDDKEAGRSYIISEAGTPVEPPVRIDIGFSLKVYYEKKVRI